jgi:hypothetical protein
MLENSPGGGGSACSFWECEKGEDKKGGQAKEKKDERGKIKKNLKLKRQLDPPSTPVNFHSVYVFFRYLKGNY